jgi:peptidoglycan/xylan/chitin deacetylase (PgdA/CDA1 family)
VEEFQSVVAARRRGNPFPVCLSFDDDLPEHIRHAAPELRRLGVPATFFLCGSAVDTPIKSFWWQRLQRASDRGVKPTEVAALVPGGSSIAFTGSGDLHRIADAVIQLPPQRRDEFATDLLELAGPDSADEVISSEGIGALVNAGFGIGFHTRRHDALTGLDDEQLHDAVRQNRHALEDIAGYPVELIAYPYGIADARVAAAARQAGYRFGFTTKRAAVTPEVNPLLLGRLQPSGESLGVFAAQLLQTLLTSPKDG